LNDKEFAKIDFEIYLVTDLIKKKETCWENWVREFCKAHGLAHRLPVQ